MMSPLFDPLLRTSLNWLSPPGHRGRLSIAIFHRVHAQTDPLFPDEPDAARFDALCSWFRSWFEVMPLDVATEALAAGRLPARALAITFDDGYADNHDVAMPVLRRHGLSATFFIATSFLDGGRMWNDTVVESIRRTRLAALPLQGLGLSLPERLELPHGAGRAQTIQQVLEAMKYLPHERRVEVARQIGERSGTELPSDLMMTTSQLRAMAAAGMQIGAHTVTHPILAGLDDAAARAEIEDSRTQLQALLGQPVELFAYPNGRPGRDYGPRDVDLVRRAGFRAAVSTSYGVSCAGTARMHELPRFTPWDRDRWRFGARMASNLRVSPAYA
jgi:peptidoglycan/xylan/chitin deacetylase (PgdA/CDA1 family)